jgi:hypothetical protein
VGQPVAVKYIAPGNVPPLPANRKYKIPTEKTLYVFCGLLARQKN